MADKDEAVPGQEAAPQPAGGVKATGGGAFNSFRLMVMAVTAALYAGVVFASAGITQAVVIPKLSMYMGKDVVFGIRPEDIHSPESAIGVENKVDVQTEVDVVEPMGNEIFVTLRTQNHTFIARLKTNNIPQIGNSLDLIFDLNKVHFFDKESGQTL